MGTGGVEVGVCGATRPLPRFFTSLGVAGFYYHLGANIQPGVLGKGGRVVVTDLATQRSTGEIERLLYDRERDECNKERGGHQ